MNNYTRQLQQELEESSSLPYFEDMKGKNGSNILVGDIVKIAGDKVTWTVMTDQDEFGDVTIKCNKSGANLHRHPKSLIVCA